MDDFIIWKPFKALYAIINDPPPPVPSKQAKSTYHDPHPDTPESFARTASIIFTALQMFPDALKAVRDALRPISPLPNGIPA